MGGLAELAPLTGELDRFGVRDAVRWNLRQTCGRVCREGLQRKVGLHGGPLAELK